METSKGLDLCCIEHMADSPGVMPQALGCVDRILAFCLPLLFVSLRCTAVLNSSAYQHYHIIRYHGRLQLYEDLNAVLCLALGHCVRCCIPLCAPIMILNFSEIHTGQMANTATNNLAQKFSKLVHKVPAGALQSGKPPETTTNPGRNETPQQAVGAMDEFVQSNVPGPSDTSAATGTAGGAGGTVSHLSKVRALDRLYRTLHRSAISQVV